MKIILITLLFKLSLIATSTKNIGETKELDAANYKETRDNTGYALILYFSPNCRFSTAMIGEFKEAENILSSFFDKTYFTNYYKINTAKHKDLDTKVVGTPALRFYLNGGLLAEYSGVRTKVGIVNFILRTRNIFSLLLPNESDIQKFNELARPVVFFGPLDRLKEFHSATEAINDEVIFANHCHEYNINPDIDIKKSYVRIYNENKYAEEELDFGNPHKFLQKFINKHLYPKVNEFNEPNSKLIFSLQKPALIFYSSPKDRNTYTELANSLDTSVYENILVVVIGKVENENLEGRLLSLTNSDHKDFPSVKIIQRTDKLEYVTMKGEITKENILKFVNNFEVNRFNVIKVEKDDL